MVLATAFLSLFSALSASSETPAAAGTGSRTIVVGVSVDQAEAKIVAYTVKDRPWRTPDRRPAPRAVEDGGAIQLEITLFGPRGAALMQRIDLAGLCLDHDGDAEAHVEGDTIRLHRESVVVELPEWAGHDAFEVGYYRRMSGILERVPLGRLKLTADRFTSAGGAAHYADLAFASTGLAPGAPEAYTPGTVHWPEEYGETDIYRTYGNLAETGRRINVALVPDGYTHADKTVLETHAQSLVDVFRSKTPYAQHDPFINYHLVYAYSSKNGTDQCDCAIVRDTAMNTRFPDAGYPCGNSGNRCLFYGTENGGPSCDPNTSTFNIVAAELRAPAADVTLIMVNTERYGGCGGSRAVYAAGNPNATEIAVHELGHSLAGLDDEYEGYPSCGGSAGEINTSLDGVNGAWPEWTAELGEPYQGAQYYSQCIYRPSLNCEMRALGGAFCPVCSQRFSLTFFGHVRVNPTAPISSSAPESPVTATVGRSAGFSVSTRLATGGGVTNSFTWRLEGPGFPPGTIIATGSPALTRSFTEPGTYTLTCEVIADTNFVKPAKTGANRDVAIWSVVVFATAEVSGEAGSPPLTVARAGTNVTLRFQDVAAARYNVYVSNSPTTSPFQVSDPSNGKKNCAVAVTPAGAGSLEVADYDPEAGITGDRSLLFILVTADNGAGTEGTLGQKSGAVRTADSYCSR